MKFVADAMLGKLAKWLRVLGYDTHYQNFYRDGVIDQLLKDGRWLLSLHVKKAEQYDNMILLHTNRVGEQLNELKNKIDLAPDRLNWFTRCLVCNVYLQSADQDAARDNVPEYVFFSNLSGIRLCPSCGRYYWPGSHRKRMLKQLEEWGFLE